jgi:large subunit ribosomal protein L30
MADKKTIKLQQVKSGIGRGAAQRDTLKGLGFRKMHQVVEVEDTPAVRGMIRAVAHLVEVVEERG